ncbi:hypothetical protein ACN47E_005097 [Coniothyrium glycines]
MANLVFQPRFAEKTHKMMPPPRPCVARCASKTPSAFEASTHRAREEKQRHPGVRTNITEPSPIVNIHGG